MVTRERERDEAPEYVLAPELQDELIRHPGKWAAITQTELIALADTSEEAYRLAGERGIETPILYHVPDQRARSYYY